MSAPLDAHDAFAALEPPRECLSGRRVSLWALDELAPDERAGVAAHLARCARCSARVAAEREAVARAMEEPLPSFAPRAAVVSLAERRAEGLAGRGSARRRGWLAAAGVLALAALALLLTRSGGGAPGGLEGDGDRAKGSGPTIEVAIQRQGVLLGEPVAIAAAPALAADDKLRLRVGRGAGIHIALEGFDAGAWIELYRGVIPDDGWLPPGLTVTAGSPTRLRMLVCAAPLTAGEVGPSPPLDALRERPGCSYREHSFEVR